MAFYTASVDATASFYARDMIIYSGSATGSDGLPSNNFLFMGASPGTAASIQITASSNGQGFIAVNKNQYGHSSTILRAESPDFSGDNQMASLTQKGSGSFAILLDADEFAGGGRPDAKFVIESNNPLPNVGTRLFHVSESGEVCSHGYLTVSRSLEVGTDITASGNISASSYLGPIDGGTY